MFNEFFVTYAEYATRAHQDEFPGEAFQLAVRERGRVADNAALGAPEGQIHHRRFPGHQACEAVQRLKL